MTRDELREGVVFKVGHRIFTVVEVRPENVFRLRDNGTGEVRDYRLTDEALTYLGQAGEGRWPAL